MLNKEYYYNASIEDVFYLEGIDKDMDIRDFDRWLNSEHAILDDSERRYLRCVVLPFYDNVISIAKSDTGDGMYYISINIRNKKLAVSETVCLPYFRGNEMYSGMEADKSYTLEELGIFK
jgi:hypothetical protein